CLTQSTSWSVASDTANCVRRPSCPTPSSLDPSTSSPSVCGQWAGRHVIRSATRRAQHLSPLSHVRTARRDSTSSPSITSSARAANELQRKHVEGTRLGIPVLLAEEALIVLKVRDATTFPDAIAQAATWDPDLIEEMAGTIGTQMSRLGVRQAFSPLADVARD